MMSSGVFGNLSGASDAELPDIPPGISASVQDDSQLPDGGGPLYGYRHDGKINGIVVEDGSRGLKIDRDAVVENAFELVRVPHVDVFSISGGDCEDLRRYREILDAVYGGSALIVTEERHYDPQEHCFNVWLQYDTVFYRLNSRYDYIREY